jgi:hypothetical protein
MLMGLAIRAAVSFKALFTVFVSVQHFALTAKH